MKTQFRFFDASPASTKSNGAEESVVAVVAPKPKRKRRMRVVFLSGKLQDRWVEWAKGLGGKWKKQRGHPKFEETV